MFSDMQLLFEISMDAVNTRIHIKKHFQLHKPGTKIYAQHNDLNMHLGHCAQHLFVYK